jgi:hypothetical protein
MSATNSGRFAIVPARAVDDNRLEPAALLILVALGTYSDRDGYCWPSQQVIADRIGVTRQAVGRQIGILQNLGYIEIKRLWDKDAQKTHNAYKVLFDAELPSEAKERHERQPAEKIPEPVAPKVAETTDATSEVASTDATCTRETDATSGCCPNVPLTTQLINTGDRMNTDEYKKRIEVAMWKGITENAGKVDVSSYPEEIQKTLKTFCQLWHLNPPRMKKGKNGEAADWINGAREINDACGEFGLDLLYLYAEEFEKYRADNQGLAPYRVARPGSIVKSLRGLAGEVRTQGLSVGTEKTIVMG